MKNPLEVRQRWAHRAIVAAGPDHAGSPSPANIEQWAGQLAAMAETPAHELAVVRLSTLHCAVEMLNELADAVREGEDRLHGLGLPELAVADPGGAPDAMRRVLNARLRAENPPVPHWLGPARQGANVLAIHGEPDGAGLAEMGLEKLDERLTKLGAERAEAEARAGFIKTYRPTDSVDMTLEAGAVQVYARLLAAAQQAFDEAPCPRVWEAPTCPRRVFQKIQLRNPALAMDMMQPTAEGKEPVTITEAAA